MRTTVLMIAVVGMLAGCVSGKPPTDTYTDRTGQSSRIETDREQCERSCNEEYSRCMETTAAQNSAVIGPSGMFGASADCRNDLSSCLPRCKAR